MPSHARTVTRKTHRVRNALLVVLLLLVVCAAAAGFSGFKLYCVLSSWSRPFRRFF